MQKTVYAVVWSARLPKYVLYTKYGKLRARYSARKEYVAEGCEEQRAVVTSYMRGNSWHKFIVVTATIQAILHTATTIIEHRF